MSSVRVMFADAAEMRGIPRDPCLGVRWKKHTPRKHDKDPRWRRGLRAWSIDDLVLLTTDERIPEDHRLLNALRFLSGLRPSSEATLRFGDIDTCRAPLWALSVTTAFDSRSRTEKDQTKTGVEYLVPVHPVLRRALESWRAAGWERFVGRPPNASDFVITTHRLTPNVVPEAGNFLRRPRPPRPSPPATLRDAGDVPEPLPRGRGRARRGEPHHAPEPVAGVRLLRPGQRPVAAPLPGGRVHRRASVGGNGVGGGKGSGAV